MLELLAINMGSNPLLQSSRIGISYFIVITQQHVSNMGGTHSELCNAIAKEIWLWTMTQGVKGG